MRARGLRGALALLIAGSGLGLPEGPARAEEPALAPDTAESGEAARTRRARSRRDSAQLAERQEEWWSRAREILFRDLTLSAEQVRGVDAIFEKQRAARKRAQELRTELATARKQGDPQRIAGLRKELRANGDQLRNPHAHIDEMRALLTEDQRPTFDMNRAHLVAEGQQAQQGRKERRARQPDAGAAADAP
jgi:hypothetical protein